METTIARRCLAAALAIGLLGQALLYSTDLGINVPILAVLILGSAFVVADWGRRLDPLDIWLPIAALVVPAGVALRSDPFTVLLDVATSATLLGASMAALAGAAVTRRSAMAIVGLGFVVLAFVFGGIARLAMLAGRLPGERPIRGSLPPAVVPILRGLLIALPVVLVFVALFSAADAVFASIAERIFAWDIDLAAATERTVLALAITWVVGGLLAVAVGADRLLGVAGAQAEGPPPAMQSLGAAVAEPVPAWPRLGAVEAVTILASVVVLFAIFVGLQVAYLFGGLDTLAAAGITYSDYARRGFFELVAVTLFAGGLVAAVHGVVERRTRAIVGSSVALAVLTFAILASAALRLRLYQDAYGWTELRFFVYATIGWVAIAIVGGTVLLVRDRLNRLPHLLAVSAVAVLVAVNVVGAPRHVADSNVARLLDPSLVPADGRRGLDVYYLIDLGDDAVPAMVRALPALSAWEHAVVLDELERRWAALSTPHSAAWPAWNLARERAREALRPLFDR